MRVRVEVEYELELPDQTGDLDERVKNLLIANRNKPLSQIFRGVRVTGVTKVHPWEDELPGF